MKSALTFSEKVNSKKRFPDSENLKKKFNKRYFKNTILNPVPDFKKIEIFDNVTLNKTNTENKTVYKSNLKNQVDYERRTFSSTMIH